MVAIKVIPIELIKTKNLYNQICREIMLQLYLDHPNIVQMYGMFSENNNLYLIL